MPIRMMVSKPPSGWRWSGLMHPGKNSLARMVDCSTTGQPACWNLESGTFQRGAPGDITFSTPSGLDLRRQTSLLEGRNSPFDRHHIPGRPITTIVDAAS